VVSHSEQAISTQSSSNNLIGIAHSPLLVRRPI
jgi:hypothetical protein